MVSESRFFPPMTSGEPCPGWPHRCSNASAALSSLCCWGFPPAGSALAVLARCLEEQTGHPVRKEVWIPPFTAMIWSGWRCVPCRPPTSRQREGRDVLLVDDVIFTGRTIRAALEAIQAWGRPEGFVAGHGRPWPSRTADSARLLRTGGAHAAHETIELRLLDVDGEEGVFLRSLQEAD